MENAKRFYRSRYDTVLGGVLPFRWILITPTTNTGSPNPDSDRKAPTKKNQPVTRTTLKPTGIPPTTPTPCPEKRKNRKTTAISSQP